MSKSNLEKLLELQGKKVILICDAEGQEWKKVGTVFYSELFGYTFIYYSEEGENIVEVLTKDKPRLKKKKENSRTNAGCNVYYIKNPGMKYGIKNYMDHQDSEYLSRKDALDKGLK